MEGKEVGIRSWGQGVTQILPFHSHTLTCSPSLSLLPLPASVPLLSPSPPASLLSSLSLPFSAKTFKVMAPRDQSWVDKGRVDCYVFVLSFEELLTLKTVCLCNCV